MAQIDPEKIDISIKYNGMIKKIKMPLDYNDLCQKSSTEFSLNIADYNFRFYYYDEDNDKCNIGSDLYLSDFFKIYTDNGNQLTLIIDAEEKKDKKEKEIKEVKNEIKEEIIEIVEKNEIEEEKVEKKEKEEKMEKEMVEKKDDELNKIEESGISGMQDSNIDLAESYEQSKISNSFFCEEFNKDLEENEKLKDKPITEKNPEVSKEISTKYNMKKMYQSTVFKKPNKKKSELEECQEKNSEAKKKFEENQKKNEELRNKIKEIKDKIEKINRGCLDSDQNEKKTELIKSQLEEKIRAVKEKKKKFEEEKNKNIEELKLKNENLRMIIKKKREELSKLKETNQNKKKELENIQKLNTELNVKMESSSKFFKKEDSNNKNNAIFLGIEKEPSSIIQNETFMSKQSEDEIKEIIKFGYDNNNINNEKKQKKLERIKKLNELIRKNKKRELNISEKEWEKIKKTENDAKNKLKNSLILKKSKIKNDDNDDDDSKKIEEENNVLQSSIMMVENQMAELEKKLEELKINYDNNNEKDDIDEV